MSSTTSAPEQVPDGRLDTNAERSPAVPEVVDATIEVRASMPRAAAGNDGLGCPATTTKRRSGLAPADDRRGPVAWAGTSGLADRSRGTRLRGEREQVAFIDQVVPLVEG